MTFSLDNLNAIKTYKTLNMAEILNVQTVCLTSPDQPCMGTFIHNFCPWDHDLHINMGMDSHFWPDFCCHYAISGPISGSAFQVNLGELAVL